ncbi:MAG: hypothetical protein QOF44_5915, partial [Streptomyces sp.]|nr:hypothetical protein [Streptomyces sp.]
NKDTFRWQVPAPPMSDFGLESELDLRDYGYDTTLPWLDPEFGGPNYGEGKRQAESYLLRNATFPVAVARLAHVLAFEDEFTGRFRFHYERVRDGKRMASFRDPGRMSYISASDCARFLAWLGRSEITGPVNAASPDAADIYRMTAYMADVIGGRAVVEEVDDAPADLDLSAFSCPADNGVSVTLATEAGYRFTEISSWLPKITLAAAEAEV